MKFILLQHWIKLQKFHTLITTFPFKVTAQQKEFLHIYSYIKDTFRRFFIWLCSISLFCKNRFSLNYHIWFRNPPHICMINSVLLFNINTTAPLLSSLSLKVFNSGSLIPELQNRVTHYDVANQVTNSKTLFLKIFWVTNSMWKNFKIVLELVTRDF